MGDRIKNLNYYLVETGRIDVVGCCEYEQGYYCGYHHNGGVDFELEFWAPVEEVKIALRELSIVNGKFSYQSERDKVSDITQRFRPMEAPFSYTHRFELDRSYLRTGEIENILTELESAASFKRTREETKEINSSDSSRNNMKDHMENTADDRKYDDNKKKFNANLTALKDRIKERIYLFNRNRFEKDLKLLWCSGEPRCPIPVPISDCPDSGDGGTCPKPKPCPGTTYPIAELIALVDKWRVKDLIHDNWFLDITDPVGISCDNFKASTRLDKIPNLIKVQKQGYLFAPRHKTDADDNVYLASYDITNDLFTYRGKIECPENE